jgi:diguanylate cyclase (GGDEF)-like protein
LTSLHATIDRRLPPADAPSSDPVPALLARLCALLGIDSASLSQRAGDRLHLLAGSGSSAHHAALAPLQRRALEADAPLVIPDLDSSGTGLSALRFFAGIPLVTGDGQTQLLLTLADARPRSPAMAHQLAALAIDVTSRATIARLARALEQQRALTAQRLALFDRASRTARIGVWSCDLADQSLEWTDGVYDLFELPRGSALSRANTVDHYLPESRRVMEAARARAIADGTDFCVDVEILTARGARRWMRLTGNVEASDGVATRIFGMKQDITEEKLLADRTRYLAETDVMTGLPNRSQFQNRLADLDGAEHGAPIAGMLLVDLDGFKDINDSHGHALGDECLREAAARLLACCGEAVLVARIGGDEFAVLLGARTDMAALAADIVQSVGKPYMRDGRPIALSASVGAAHYHGGTADELFTQADMALYAAKAAGRSTSRTYSR